VIALLVNGLVFRDRFAWRIRIAVPFAVPLLAAVAALTYDRIFPAVPSWVHLQYIAVVTACSFLYWDQVPHLRHLKSSLVGAAIYVVAATRHMYALLQTSVADKGLDWIAWGIAFLALAVAISLIKGGLLQRFWIAVRNLNEARGGDRMTRFRRDAVLRRPR
jgi:hypothetical protein